MGFVHGLLWASWRMLLTCFAPRLSSFTRYHLRPPISSNNKCLTRGEFTGKLKLISPSARVFCLSGKNRAPSLLEMEDPGLPTQWMLSKEPRSVSAVEKVKEGFILFILSFLSHLASVSRQVFVPRSRFLRLVTPTVQHIPLRLGLAENSLGS